jgi:shikimate dehydrogenase
VQAEAFGTLAPLTVYDWSPLGFLQASDGVTLIVNTTPLGMSPNVAASPWPGDVPFPPDAFLYDLVYNPPETQLVRQARAAGLRAATGLGMLIEQGALAFELWTDLPASRAVMRQAAEKKLFGAKK